MGGTALVAGIAMIVLPGPAFIVIPAALALLATEFIWAQRLLRTLQEWLEARLARKRGGK